MVFAEVMNHTSYSDIYLRQILTVTKTIALVGASSNAARPSHGVMRFLLARGFKVTPINPGLAGQELLGQKVYGKLSEIDHAVDLIDVFRNSDQVSGLVDEILALPHMPKTIWMQLGVVDHASAARAEAKGIQVVMNRCPAIEIPRLGI